MTAGLGQEVLVENRPGGNTGIGAGAVLNAPPDGYTLLFALASNAGLPHLSKASPYKSFAEFTPIVAIGGNTQCLVVPASLPAKSLAEFISYAKARPEAVAARREQRIGRHGGRTGEQCLRHLPRTGPLQGVRLNCCRTC